MKKTAILFLVFVALAINAAAQGPEIGSKIDNFTLPDVYGKSHTLDSLKGKNGAVIIFLSAQCPVVKMYDERINQIAAEYEARGIKFIGINSNATESLEWVRSHAEEKYKFPMLIDKGNVLADKLGATVTPEVYYIDASSVLLYHGAIDNDRSAKNITDRYLKAAFDQSLSGEPVSRGKASAFGCTIKRASN